jgi:hypothetical protein
MSAYCPSPLPSRHAVRTTIGDLVGREVELTDAVAVAARSTNVVGVFVTDKLATSAIAVLDLEGAARLGGALGMVPRGGIEDVIKERAFPQHLRDNCYEVLNVLSAVFNVVEAPHVRLYQMYGPGEPAPGDVAAMAGMAGSRMDLRLMIAGYGDARMSIVVR